MSVPVYERIVDLLEVEGINTLFGIPDPGFIHMAMLAEQRGWNVVAPHHEQAGGFMADAWSRMTGKPGVCFGPSSLAASAPVLPISACAKAVSSLWIRLATLSP